MHILVAHFTAHWVQCSGGVEKVVCQFANAMTRLGHKVTILYLDEEEGAPFFPLDEGVETVNVLFEDSVKVVKKKPSPCLRLYREFFRLFSMKKVRELNARYKGKMYGSQIRKYLEKYKPDVVVACSGQSIKYTIIDGACKAPVVGMIHSDCTQTIPRLSDAELAAMDKCKAVQVLLPIYVHICKKFIPHPRILSIGNAIEETSISATSRMDSKTTHKIVCVAGLGENKNQILLANAFAKIADKYKGWCVEFWGGTIPEAVRLLSIG